MAKIYIAKLNLIDFSENFKNKEIIPNDLMKNIFNNLKPSIYDDDKDNNIYYRLSIVDINLQKSTINGRLLKVFKESDIEMLSVENENEIETHLVKNVVSSVPFSFKTDIQQISFVPRANFGRNDFLYYFKRILESQFPTFGEITFNLLMDKDGLYNKLERIDQLTLASFTIVKPNGVADDLVESIGDALIDTDAKEAIATFKGDRRSPLNERSQVFNNLIEYISRGWGYLKARGYSEDERKNVEIDTSKDVLKTFPVSENNKDSPLYIQDKAFNYED